MSCTYHLVCETCKEEIWIGQSPTGGNPEFFRLYWSKEHLIALNSFLVTHTMMRGLGGCVLEVREANFVEDYEEYQPDTAPVELREWLEGVFSKAPSK